MPRSRREDPKTVGLIGLGLMGRAFAQNLLADGYALVGTDPDPSARRKFQRMGGVPAPSPRAAAERAEILLVSVPNSKIALACARGREGYLACAAGKTPRLVIDTTTADPADARKIASLCRGKGTLFLEACVSGHSENVRNRRGLFLVGGEARARRRAAPLLEGLLSDQIFCGPAGMGAAMKVLINYLCCLERCAIAETLRLGLRAGFKGELLLDALMRSAADGRQLRNRGPRMIARRYGRPVSTVDVLTKDIKLGMKLAARTGSLTPLGRASLPVFLDAVRAGYGPLDSAAVYRVFEDREGRRGKAPRRG